MRLALHGWHERLDVDSLDQGERNRRSLFYGHGRRALSMPTALITGVAGQDGSYLAELLHSQDYSVIGTTRDARRALERPYAVALANVDLVVTPSAESAADLIRERKPDEVYHLAGPSRVSASWQDPVGTKEGIVFATALVLDAVVEMLPSPRLFVAGSCEVFASGDAAQDESAHRAPASPYATAKLEAMELVRSAREKFGLYAVTGILFNHESPRRGADFVTGKIARAAARIATQRQRGLELGNLDVRRDWGFAGDYVRAMWLMLFQDEPEDLVIGTGVAHSVADFCDRAFHHLGLNWKEHVTTNPDLIRRTDAPLRLANPARAKTRLGWTPEVDFERLVTMMVDYELQASS